MIINDKITHIQSSEIEKTNGSTEVLPRNLGAHSQISSKSNWPHYITGGQVSVWTQLPDCLIRRVFLK